VLQPRQGFYTVFVVYLYSKPRIVLHPSSEYSPPASSISTISFSSG
jgi:hypothetical protein